MIYYVAPPLLSSGRVTRMSDNPTTRHCCKASDRYPTNSDVLWLIRVESLEKQKARIH